MAADAFMWRCTAQRPLPSIMMAMCRGKRSEGMSEKLGILNMTLSPLRGEEQG